MSANQFDGVSVPAGPEALALLEQLSLFYSKFSGMEIERGIEQAINIYPFLDEHVIVPPKVMTGDLLSQEITTLKKDMWLESIVLYCQKAWSKSVGLFTYKIGAGDRDLVVIPNKLMTDEGTYLTYTINEQFPIGTRFECICESTRAFGELIVKLNFR